MYHIFYSKSLLGIISATSGEYTRMGKLMITSVETLKRNLCKFYGRGKYMPLLKALPAGRGLGNK